MEVFVICILIGLILMSIFQPLFGLYAFFIIAYLRPQDFYPFLVDIEPARWILVITFISFLFHNLARKVKFTKSKQSWAILGILLCIFISKIKAIDGIRWWQATEDFIRVCLVYFLLINTINTSKRLKNFYIFFVLINLFFALRFYISYKAGIAMYHISKPGDLTQGFLANADDLGLGMVVALAYSLIPILYVRNIFLKGLCSFASGCFMMAALVTHSRGAHIGIFTVFIVAIISQLKWRKLQKNKYFIGLTIVLFLLAAFIYKFRYTLQDSYTSIQNEQDKGRLGRISAWAAAQLMIRENPVIGVGRGNFVPYWKANYPPGIFGYQVAHNIIYEVAAEIGLIGLLFFLYFSLFGLKELRAIHKNYKERVEKYYFLDMLFAIYAIGLIGFYINGMFITVAFYWHIYILVALFVSAKHIFMREIAYEKNKTNR